MAMNFGDLRKKRKLDDGNRGKGPLRRKIDDENEDINPFRKAKKAAYREDQDHVPVEEEGSAIEEMTEGEAGHTAEEKMGEGDHGVEDGEPVPAFLEKEELEAEEGEEGSEGESEDEYPPDDEDAEDEAGLPPRKKKANPFGEKKGEPEKKREPSMSFRRYL